MLGLGWSMAMISGSALVTAAMPTQERARTQGVADMTIGVTGAAGGTMSGIVVGTIGYSALSLSGAVLAGAVLAVLVVRRRLDLSGTTIGAPEPPHL
jgi:MFS family permease